MNNIFNIQRFGLVLSKEMQEKGKKYILQFSTMFGMMVAMSIVVSYNSRYYHIDHAEFNDNLNLLILASCLFPAFGIFFASTIMDSMRNKTDRIAMLTMPASHFEKFFSRWLIACIGYVIAFFAALWMADAVRVAFLSVNYPESDIRFLDFSQLISFTADIEDDTNNGYVFYCKAIFLLCVVLYVFLQSLFILGAMFWEKLSFIKTFSAIVVIVALFISLNWLVINIFFEDMDYFGSAVRYLDIPSIKTMTLLKITMSVLIFFTLLNWILAYFRFRESEIIKRL